jgi:hypothetical protein
MLSIFKSKLPVHAVRSLNNSCHSLRLARMFAYLCQHEWWTYSMNSVTEASKLQYCLWFQTYRTACRYSALHFMSSSMQILLKMLMMLMFCVLYVKQSQGEELFQLNDWTCRVISFGTMEILVMP